jgi:spore germination cell wall hydrolase CwlJ-like protein
MTSLTNVTNELKLTPVTNEDIDILARTIYGEARGEYTRPEGGLAALIAIANVVLNRVAQRTWYGKTIKEVCLKPYQFSCWNQNDPNRTVIMTANPCKDKIFQRCMEVATKTAAGEWPDLTFGSDHYYAVWLPIAPTWSLGKHPMVKIGCHAFFNLNRSR